MEENLLTKDWPLARWISELGVAEARQNRANAWHGLGATDIHTDDASVWMGRAQPDGKELRRQAHIMAVNRRAGHTLAAIHARRRSPDYTQLGVWTPYRRLLAFQHDTLFVDLALKLEMGGDDANRHALTFRWLVEQCDE
jgi:hypothetical protein